MRSTGQLIHWDDEKGYGFIDTPKAEDNLFVHIKAFQNRNRRPQIGDQLSFNIQADKQKRLRAQQVYFQDESSFWLPPFQNQKLVITLTLFTLLITLYHFAPLAIFSLYLALSMLTFAVYALDKNAARQQAWRTPENILHLLSLSGGWMGALLAQRYLHHKSRKPSFQLIFWLTVLLNLGVLASLFTTNLGQQLLLLLN